MNIFTIAAFAGLSLSQPTKLQRMEEAIDRVLLTHSINYEKGSKLEGKLADVTVTYTGSTTIDAKEDSTTYFVYGSYTWSKYSYVQAPTVLTGGTNLGGKSYNTSGSTSYVARVKSVLDDYRVQEIIVISDPENFDFPSAEYESLKTVSDWIYPTVVFQAEGRKKNDK